MLDDTPCIPPVTVRALDRDKTTVRTEGQAINHFKEPGQGSGHDPVKTPRMQAMWSMI
jgi:hypothetical protein